MKKNKSIFNALPIVAAAYGERFGVKVEVSGDVAHTDGKTIVVPNIPEDYPHMDALWGYLAHEAAHVRFTDFQVNRYPGLHAELSNIIEDCRIERAMMGVYPGTANTLNEVARYMAQAGHYCLIEPSHPPAAILSSYCLFWLQTKLVGQTCLQGLLDNAQTVFEQVFPTGVVVRLNALLRRAQTLTSTQDAVTLTEEIMKMIEEEQEKEQQSSDGQQSQQPPSGSGDGQQASDSQEGESESHSSASGSGDGEDQSGDSGDSSNANPQGDAEDGDGNDSNSQTKPGSAGGNEPAKLLEQVLNASDDELLGDAHESLKQELTDAAEAKGNDRYQTVRSAVDVHNDQTTKDVLLKEVKSTTSKIRSQLYGLVQASQRSNSALKRSGKRVDSRRLHRLASGDTKVFIRPQDKVMPNTAVHILVDMSWS